MSARLGATLGGEDGGHGQDSGDLAATLAHDAARALGAADARASELPDPQPRLVARVALMLFLVAMDAASSSTDEQHAAVVAILADSTGRLRAALLAESQAEARALGLGGA